MAYAIFVLPSPAMANLTPLAATILSYMLAHAPPGKSEFSAEAMPECGSDPKAPTCDIRPLCEVPDAPSCAPPRWSKARKAWVRAETREGAIPRYTAAAQALADTSRYTMRCVRDGQPDEDCQPVRWGAGLRHFAMVTLTTAIYESGMREDIMHGYPPAGRGTGGEACLMQPMPSTIRQFQTWIPPEAVSELTDEDLAQEVLGDEPEKLRRCFEIGSRALARMYRTAVHRCQGKTVSPYYSMWALYGTGKHCSSVGIYDDFARKRLRLLGKLQTSEPLLPEWFKVASR